MKKTPLVLMMTSCFFLCMPLLLAEGNLQSSPPTLLIQAFQDEYENEEESVRPDSEVVGEHTAAPAAPPQHPEGSTLPPKPSQPTPPPQPKPTPPQPHSPPNPKQPEPHAQPHPQQPTPHAPPKTKPMPQPRSNPSSPSSKAPKPPAKQANKSLTAQPKQVVVETQYQAQEPVENASSSENMRDASSQQSSSTQTLEAESKQAHLEQTTSQFAEAELLEKPVVRRIPKPTLRPSPRPSPLIIDGQEEVQVPDQ